MRFVAIILATYISFFAILPALKQLGVAIANVDICCVKNNCKEDPTGSEKNKKTPVDCCCNGVYATCCLVYNTAQKSFQFANMEESAQKHRLVNDNVTSNYLSDCWHPPELG